MKNMMNKMKDFLMPQDEYDDDEDELEEVEVVRQEPIVPKHRQPMPSSVPQPKLVAVGGAQNSRMDILNFTMSNYEMTGEVFNYIKNRKPIIVNMQPLNAADVQRAVDYLTGACYALNGAVEKVADNIFVFAPENVNLSPETLKQKNTWPHL